MSASLRGMLRSPLFIVAGVLLLWFCAAFLVWPNLRLLGEVFAPNGTPSMRAFERLASSDRAMLALRNSFVLAAILAVTVNLLGVFIVLATRYFDIKGARILYAGYATTLVYGGIVQVAGYKLIYGEHGFITNLMASAFPEMDRNWFTGMAAVVFVMTISGTGNHLLFMTNALARVDYQSIEAAKMMGASGARILRTIVLPTLKPMIFAITILTFLGGLGALAAPQVLGGTDFQTITPMILAFAGTPSSRDLAATLAMILGLSTVVLLAILNKLERGGTYFAVSKVPAAMKKQRIENRAANVVVHVLAYLFLMVYVVPPLLIVVFSFTDAASINSGTLAWSSFTLRNYAEVFSSYDAFWPFLVSIGYGAFAAIVTVGGLLFVARLIQKHRNWMTAALEYVLHIPWILPSTMIALGLVVAYDHPTWVMGNAVLTGTVGLLAITYVILKIPFTLRMLKAAFGSVPDHLEDAAAILGAKPLTIFRMVLLPIVAPTAAAIAALNFNSLLDDYDTAVFVSHPLYQPLGIVIKNATSQDTLNDATALTFVYTVLLMSITAGTLWLVYGRRSARPGRRTPRRRPPTTPSIRPAPVEPALPHSTQAPLTKEEHVRNS